ncbi:site-specific tyrosine recombinase/integron integrase [Polaribacter glomeratus]|uniref:Integrase n=1 Tax=Polaribacter glomeratus TaxID=102 RepID=A0A2S7WYL8_9FLAO|nr:site-specific tyrosine recombinase/integron integrase [Polaribacter glomeratus]PQJ82687.1 integrase [Polaribacter glomeratus]TXD63998.1 tyrosine-type recombinase/integrase [Polaribacter glomeratus]
MLYPTIFLEQKSHKKELKLLLKFEYNNTLINLTRKLKNARWSKTLNSWHVDFTQENIALITKTFKDITPINSDKLPKKELFKRNLTDSEKMLLNDFYLYLKGKRYSQSTLQTYTFFVADFINFYTKKPLDELTNRDVELFIEKVFIERNYSVSSQRQFISALKLFIVFYPQTKINDLVLVRPKKSRKLPSVLSQEEVLTIIQCTRNLKHRAIIALLYSCGLRISELINLKLADFHIERKQLIVKNGKGRKDRYVSLADSFLPLLSNYYHSYKPELYFVEGQNGGKYSSESVRQFLRKSSLSAKIKKNVTPHTLRHSYATHLLENGVDIRYIQSLLGHAKPETTMIYTHVKRKDLMDIQNPLDIALKKINNRDNEKGNLLLSGDI